MLLLLLSILALVIGTIQTKTIKSRIEKQGLIISKNLAAISVEHLITYNYIAIEKLVNQAAEQLDIVDVIIYDKEGKIAGYSGRPDLQNTILTDKTTINALKAKAPRIAISTPENNRPSTMDIAVPVYLPESRDRWGTIRVCLSLEQMRQQKKQTLLSIFILGFVFLITGVVISNWLAQRITKPLEQLTRGTIEAAQGNFDQQFPIQTRDEVEILSSNFSIMIQEILSQKQLLQNQLDEIKQLQQYAEKILRTMNDGLLAVDMDGIIVTANRAAHVILNLPHDQIVKGCHVFEVFNQKIPFTTYIQQILDNPFDQNQREIHLEKGEETQILLTSANVLESDNNTPQQIIFNINDITALKSLEAKIRRNQRLADLGILAAGMSHEIRNPLSAIKTYVDLLPKKMEKPGFLDKFQRTVPREINRLNNLVEDLLELSRQTKYTFVLTDMGQLLMQSIELLEADFSKKGVDCQWNFPKALPKIEIDINQLKKVFINLMQNSAQAMPNGGAITIDISCKETMVTLNFSDTGQGFSHEISEKIFNPFYTTKIKGTGIWLAITHKIISDHGGQIKVSSTEGIGCCFSIRLPIKQGHNSVI